MTTEQKTTETVTAFKDSGYATPEYKVLVKEHEKFAPSANNALRTADYLLANMPSGLKDWQYAELRGWLQAKLLWEWGSDTLTGLLHRDCGPLSECCGDPRETNIIPAAVDL